MKIKSPYIKLFYYYFHRLPTKEEHLAFVKLHVMPNEKDKQIVNRLKQWKNTTTQ